MACPKQVKPASGNSSHGSLLSRPCSPSSPMLSKSCRHRSFNFFSFFFGLLSCSITYLLEISIEHLGATLPIRAMFTVIANIVNVVHVYFFPFCFVLLLL